MADPAVPPQPKPLPPPGDPQADARFLHELASISDEVFWVFDVLAGRNVYVSPACEALFGQPARVLREASAFFSIVHPDDRDWITQALGDNKLAQPLTVEYRIVREPDGVREVRWIQTRTRPVFDADNRLLRVCGITRDVTDLRRQQDDLTERERHYRRLADTNRRLLDEVNHRVRNNLSSLIGLLQLTRRQARDLDDFVQAMRDRIAAMAQGHNLLAESDWNDVDFRTILQRTAGAVQPSAPHAIHMSLVGPDTQVTPRQAVPLAMAFTELFTNSIKYGACSTPAGTLDIAWTLQQPDGRPPCIDLTWSETGGPAIDAPPGQSLGTELIEGFIRFELRGQCTLAFPREGARHHLVIPLIPELPSEKDPPPTPDTPDTPDH